MRDPARNIASRDGETENSKKRSRIRVAAAIIGVAVALIAVVLVLVSIWHRQNATLRRLEEEKAAKQTELNEKELRKDSLQERLSVIGSRQYLIRYLREHHGMIFPGDIRIDVDDPNAVIPPPDQGSTNTPEPAGTEEPDPTEEPSPTDEPDGNE